MPDQAGQNALVFCSVYQFIVVCIRNTLINNKIHNIKKSVELYSWCISLHTGLAPCLKYYLWTRRYELCANTASLLRYTTCYGAKGRRGHGLGRVKCISLLPTHPLMSGDQATPYTRLLDRGGGEEPHYTLCKSVLPTISISFIWSACIKNTVNN